MGPLDCVHGGRHRVADLHQRIPVPVCPTPVFRPRCSPGGGFGSAPGASGYKGDDSSVGSDPTGWVMKLALCATPRPVRASRAAVIRVLVPSLRSRLVTASHLASSRDGAESAVIWLMITSGSASRIA